MDDVNALAAAQRNGTPAPPGVDQLPAALSEWLGVPVTHIHVYGRGPGASVDVFLADGQTLTFERFSDVAKPTALAQALVTQTGVYKSFKPAEAGAIAAAIFRLAEHHVGVSADETAAEWGREFLRLAPTQDTDLSDQGARWRSFEALARVNPARDADVDRSSYALATAAVVLADCSGVRLVRCGWFLQYVRREAGGLYTPASLASQMARVGWERRGSEGRIKATAPGRQATLVWTFYSVEPGWETASDRGSREASQVNG